MISKEGTFRPPESMTRYLKRHLRRCLSKEEREALFKEHPRPDLESCSPPQADKFMTEYLGKRFPKEFDSKMSKVQTAVLAIVRPLTSAWRSLLEEGLEGDQDLMVPATEVLALCQRTLCLVGNAAEMVSQERRAKILDTVDPSWAKFGTESFPDTGKFLFGDDFKSSLAERVEKDSALSKAVALTKRGKSPAQLQPSSSHFRRGRYRTVQFFPRGPPAGYGSRQGKNPYHTTRDLPHSGSQLTRRPYQTQRFGQRPQFHEPCLPADPPFPRPQPKK